MLESAPPTTPNDAPRTPKRLDIPTLWHLALITLAFHEPTYPHTFVSYNFVEDRPMIMTIARSPLHRYQG